MRSSLVELDLIRKCFHFRMAHKDERYEIVEGDQRSPCSNSCQHSAAIPSRERNQEHSSSSFQICFCSSGSSHVTLTGSTGSLSTGAICLSSSDHSMDRSEWSRVLPDVKSIDGNSSTTDTAATKHRRLKLNSFVNIPSVVLTSSQSTLGSDTDELYTKETLKDADVDVREHPIKKVDSLEVIGNARPIPLAKNASRQKPLFPSGQKFRVNTKRTFPSTTATSNLDAVYFVSVSRASS